MLGSFNQSCLKLTSHKDPILSTKETLWSSTQSSISSNQCIVMIFNFLCVRLFLHYFKINLTYLSGYNNFSLINI
ncbi:hypothetical protein BpHYR1_036017 [Brachionus plicatilis]|uniref:Uncharacterized protein n=1 Tax=Brachionus plicatilis TaxID=10195 RepID=A0A3M7SXH5_BRAPC|nr:hypothetical protein BpHYR1_036017 [Brachionus plicatilis]